MDGRIQGLLDRDAIDAALATYCRGIDRHDVEITNRAYFPDAFDNHGPFRDQVSHGFAEWGNELHESKATAHMHNLTTRWAEVRGDVAAADTYLIFTLLLRDSPMVSIGSGRYIDRLEKRNGEWRIARRETAIDIRFVADATEWARSQSSYPSGAWDRSDMSYQQPVTLPQDLRAALDTGNHTPDRNGVAASHPLEVRPRDPEALIDWLLARRQIGDRISCSLRGLDRQDRGVTESAYVGDATIHLGSGSLDLDNYIRQEFARADARDLAQARHATTQNVVLDGDEAVAETCVIDMRRRRGDREVWIGGTRLVDRLVRSGQSWQIAERQMIVDWEFLSDQASFDPSDAYLRSFRGHTDILALDSRDQQLISTNQQDASLC